MIQRVQTLYLIGVIGAGILLLSIPAASLIVDGELINFYARNVWSLATLVAVTILLALITIFCYKRQMLQIRLSIFNLVVEIGTAIYLFLYCYNNIDSTMGEWRIGVAMAMPIIQIILTLLAMKGISKDLVILRSLDRLR